MPTITEDKLAIQEIMYSYALMVDNHRWYMMDNIFAPEAIVDYVSSGGQKGPYKETMAWLERALKAWPLNLHFITNPIINIKGDTANSTVAYNAPMGKIEADGSQFMMTNIGYYYDKWVRLNSEWRILDRVCDQTITIGGLPENYTIPT
tara:strand:- start:7 stop:453 length:447 start_codon:yes stop_codon:yes gene_type:complete